MSKYWVYCQDISLNKIANEVIDRPKYLILLWLTKDSKFKFSQLHILDAHNYKTIFSFKNKKNTRVDMSSYYL